MAIGMKLSAKQERFCREYIIDLNATQAAIRAGYSARSANSMAARLIVKDSIQKKIRELQNERAAKLEVSAAAVVRELARLAFFDPGTVVRVLPGGVLEITPTDQLTDDQRRAVAAVSQSDGSTRIRFADKLRALELLGKHLGLFVERQEVVSRVTQTDEMSDEQLMKIAGFQSERNEAERGADRAGAAPGAQ